MNTSPIDPVQPPAEGGFLAPKPGSVPGDRCYRCGRPTPAGVAVCTACNPGKVKGPSATQLHATILGGVILGAIVLLMGWRFAGARVDRIRPRSWSASCTRMVVPPCHHGRQHRRTIGCRELPRHA